MLNFQNRMIRYYKILCTITFFVVVISGVASGAEALTQTNLIKCNEYDIILREPKEENNYTTNIQLYKGKQNIFTSSEDYNISRIEDYCKKDFLGNKTPVIIVTTWSGGAHCCNTSYFLELGGKFRLIQKMETYDSDIELISQGHNKPYKLKLQDRVFNYFYTSFVYSVAPDVILKFNGDKFIFDDQAMLRKVNKQEFAKLLANLEIKLKKDHDFIDFLDQVVTLIYSGNADFALKLIDGVLTKYDFNKLTPTIFKKDLLCKIQKSQYIEGIQRINNNSLVIPLNCKEENLDDFIDYKKFRKTPL